MFVSRKYLPLFQFQHKSLIFGYTNIGSHQGTCGFVSVYKDFVFFKGFKSGMFTLTFFCDESSQVSKNMHFYTSRQFCHNVNALIVDAAVDSEKF